MDTTIYRKSERGLQELSSRERRLAPGLRSALILVDGRKPARDLQALLGPHYLETLRSLEDLGLIEAIQPARSDPPAPAAPVKAPSPAPGTAPRARQLPSREVEAIRRQAVRWLSHRMGPYADGVNLKIEKCKSADDLLAALRLGYNIVKQQLGATVADQFHAEFIDATESA